MLRRHMNHPNLFQIFTSAKLPMFSYARTSSDSVKLSASGRELTPDMKKMLVNVFRQ